MMLSHPRDSHCARLGNNFRNKAENILLMKAREDGERVKAMAAIATITVVSSKSLAMLIEEGVPVSGGDQMTNTTLKCWQSEWR